MSSNMIDSLMADIVGQDPSKPGKPKQMGVGEWMFLVAQAVCILFFGLFTEYGENVHPSTESDVGDGEYDPNRDIVQNLYPFFQDVHVMIFIGFGFLMVFVKTSSWSALCLNWVISAWALQWAILILGFWEQVFHSTSEWEPVQVSIVSLIRGDFAAGAAMITFGAILGKCNLQQLFFLVWWEMIFYGLNETICVELISVSDAGGSILVHTFGAYFGLAATYGFQPHRAKASANAQTSHASQMVAMVGSIFLWMYWPSFNGALASGVAQHRIVVNTVLGIAGSCIGAAIVGRLSFGKMDMEMMLNSTLAGGVAVGSSADLISAPWAALLIGLCGGIGSSFGFHSIGPWLSDSRLNLQDTCGVHNLHGMPGVFAALVSMIVIARMDTSGNQGFPSDYLPIVGDGGTYSDQAAAQAESLLITLGISIVSGYIGGWICSCDCFSPPHALFRDDDHFQECLDNYPPEYFTNCDEAGEYAVEGLKTWQAGLARVCADENPQEAITTKVWNEHAAAQQDSLDKSELLSFINNTIDATFEASGHGGAMHVYDGAVYNALFKHLDTAQVGKVARSKLLEYMVQLSQEKPVEEPVAEVK